MSSEDQCLPCTGGYYCFSHGATSFDPSRNDTGIGLCSAGYYCKEGNLHKLWNIKCMTWIMKFMKSSCKYGKI